MHNIQIYIVTWYHVLHDLNYVGHLANKMICSFQNKPHFSKSAHVVQSNVAQTSYVFYSWASSSGIQWWVCTSHNYQDLQGIGWIHAMVYTKKLSQFNNFWYIFKFDASWWIFGKYFVMKICNGWWYMFNSIVMLWN
jgi:hypothetical protein